MVTALCRFPLVVGVLFTVTAISSLAVFATQLVFIVIAAAASLSIAALWTRWYVLVLVALEPFGDLLGQLHPLTIKLAGATLVMGWITRLLVQRRSVRINHPVLISAGALALVLLAAFTAHPNGASGVEVSIRYASYLAILVVLVDSMEHGLRPMMVAATFVISCSAAAAYGTVAYLVFGATRAAGPQSDANDFAFFLLCAVPLAVALYARSARRVGWIWAVLTVVLISGIALTFSRGALLALGAMLVITLVRGYVRARYLIAGATLIAVAAMAITSLAPQEIQRSLTQKEYVADANVSSRMDSWAMAAEMTADYPLLGRGPGGYRSTAHRYIPENTADTTHLAVPHNMYLDISSELGIPGLVAFLAMIGLALHATLRPSREDSLAAAVFVALIGTGIAAVFLSEQYYLPIWLLIALAVANEKPQRYNEFPSAIALGGGLSWR